MLKALALTVQVVNLDEVEHGLIGFDCWQTAESCVIDTDEDLDGLLGKHVTILFLCREDQDSHYFALMLMKAGKDRFRRISCMQELHDARDTSAHNVEGAQIGTFSVI